MIPIRREWSAMKRLALLSPALATPAVEDTATGNPLKFQTDLAKPLKSLLIPFTPQQEGTGDPSPQNIRSILPWNGLTVFGGGKNLLNPVADDWLVRENTYRYINGVVPEGATARFTLEVKDSTVDISGCYLGFVLNDLAESSPTGYKWIIEGGTVKTDMSNLSTGGSQVGQRCSNVFIYPATAETFQKLFSRFNVMVELGSTATAYEPYHPITDTDIVFPSPVYGGTLDVVSGVLTVEWTTKQFDGSSDENWYFVQVGSSSWYRAYIIMSDAKQPNDISAFADSYKAVSFNNRSYSSKVCMFGNENESPIIFNVITELTTIEDFEAYLAENPLTIAYKLATPQEIQLTQQQITAIVGDNTIWSDADGSMTAVFQKKK